MEIECATEADIPAIAAVIEESDRVHRAQLPHIFCPKTGPVRPEGFLANRIAGPDSVIFVARDGSRIVGVLEAEIPRSANRDGFVPRRLATIDNVVVMASHRDRGIGSALMNCAHEWAKSRNAEATRLHVWASNPEARRLYERLGYETVLYRMERAV